MSRLILRQRLDKAINKLCDIRNEVAQYHDVDFDIDESLGSVEESIEKLAQEVDQEVQDI